MSWSQEKLNKAAQIAECATIADPNFAAVAERITDSQNEFIQFLMTEHSSGRAEKRGNGDQGQEQADPQ